MTPEPGSPGPAPGDEDGLATPSPSDRDALGQPGSRETSEDAPREPVPLRPELAVRPELLQPEAPQPEPDPPQEDDVTLGALLREARRRRAVTLDEVARDTRINPQYLEALEAGRYEVLPAPVYARGFARSYGRYLGLDPEVVRGLIPRDLPRPPELEPTAGLRRTHEERLMSALPSLRLPSRLPLRPALMAGGVVVAALAVLFGIGRITGGDSTAAPVTSVATPALGTDGAASGVGTAAGPPDAATAAAEVTVEPTAAPTIESTPAAAIEATVAPTVAAPLVATVPPFQDGRMPDFSGVVRGEAEQVLEGLGLSFVVIEVGTEAAPAGIVFDQAPAPGERADGSLDVTLIVSQGAPRG